MNWLLRQLNERGTASPTGHDQKQANFQIEPYRENIDFGSELSFLPARGRRACLPAVMRRVQHVRRSGQECRILQFFGQVKKKSIYTVKIPISPQLASAAWGTRSQDLGWDNSLGVSWSLELLPADEQQEPW
jgi:hypothetical protein